MEEYHTLLVAEKEKSRELARLKREQEKLKVELDQVKQKEMNYKRTLEAEQVDVDKLEGFSLTALFMTIAGKKEDRLDKEKQEVLAVQLKLKEATAAKQDLEIDLARLRDKIVQLGDPEANYQQLLLDKQDYLLSTDHKAGERARALLEKIAELNSDSKEIKEALNAGTSAKEALSDAIDSLNKAKNWGTLDMFGGGLISTSMKHSNMDTAQEEVHQSQHLLRRFSRELDDIGHKFQADLSISGGLTFMDYFFDGLISDWLVQDKINNSLSEVEDMYSETGSVLNKLQQLLVETNQTISNLEDNWERLVAEAK